LKGSRVWVLGAGGSGSGLDSGFWSGCLDVTRVETRVWRRARAARG